MAKIDSATLDVINDYYNGIIKNLEKMQREIQVKKEREYRENFNDNALVRNIRALFKDLEKLYEKDNLVLKCELYAFADSQECYKKDKKWIEVGIEIRKLKNEKSLLITGLECNSKNSTEYKEAYKKLQKLFKE